MKKILITFLIALLATLFGFMVINGVQIGGIKIASIKQIMEESDELDSIIENASKLSKVDYEQAGDNIDTSMKRLAIVKEEYADLIEVSTEDQINDASIKEIYEIQFLWTTIGNYALNCGVVLKLEVLNSGTNIEGQYNIKFTVTGEYIPISDFIYDIEDDSTLGFRIEDFGLVAATTEDGNVSNLQATFTVKNIAINIPTTTNTATEDIDTLSEGMVEE